MPQMATYDPSILARAQENMRLAQEIGLRPGDPSWIKTKAEADAFHAQDAIQQQKNQARDAAMNGGLGAAWISGGTPGDPRNYSNYTGPQGTGAPPPGATGQWQPGGPGTPFVNIGQPLPAGYGGAPKPAAAPPPAAGAVAPPGAGGAPYALDVNKYLDPSMAFTMAEGLRGLNSSAAAGGQQFAGNTMREIMKYSQGLAGQNWNNAAQLAAQQQGFGRNIDVNNRDFTRNSFVNDRDFTQNQNIDDRNFAYKVGREDQTTAFDQNMQQQQLGVQAAANQNSLANTIAQLMNKNIMTGGEAEAGGSLAGGGIGSNAMNQIIAMLTEGSLMNQFPQFKP